MECLLPFPFSPIAFLTGRRVSDKQTNKTDLTFLAAVNLSFLPVFSWPTNFVTWRMASHVSFCLFLAVFIDLNCYLGDECSWNVNIHTCLCTQTYRCFYTYIHVLHTQTLLRRVIMRSRDFWFSSMRFDNRLMDSVYLNNFCFFSPFYFKSWYV